MSKRVVSLGFAFLAMCVFTANVGAIPTPVGWWQFNEGSGDIAYDSSGSGNNATIYNVDNGGIKIYVCDTTSPVWYNDPDRGWVAGFGGDDTAGAYADAGMIIPELTFTQDFTWVFWSKQVGDGTGANMVVLGNRYGASDSLNFSKFTPTKFEFYDNGDMTGFIDYTDPPCCEWIHHAVVKDGDTFTYYRHDAAGNLIETGSSITTAELVALPLYFGGDAAGERWSGWLSDVRIYDVALTPAEVTETVPEPTTIALLGFGALAALKRRRA